MSKKDWRFDPKEDYRDFEDDDSFGRHRKGFTGMKHTRKWHNDKYDGKRRRKENRERW